MPYVKYLTLLPLVLLLGMSGCRHACKKQRAPQTFGPGPGQGNLIIGQPIPLNPTSPPSTFGAPGQPFTGTPGSSNFPPPRAPEVLSPAPLSTAPSNSQKRPLPRVYTPNIGSNIQFGDPVPRAPLAQIPPPATIPDTSSGLSPLAQVPMNDGGQSPSPPLPVGIPNFSPAQDGIAVGLRPEEEGFEWLRDQKYKTVLFLHRGSEDVNSDRKAVEALGMRFVSLEITTDQVTPQMVQTFTTLVKNESARPLFIYDLSGPLTGGMFYLYYRTAGQLGNDEARLRAGRLGLSEQGNEEQIRFWKAIQLYLR